MREPCPSADIGYDCVQGCSPRLAMVMDATRALVSTTVATADLEGEGRPRETTPPLEQPQMDMVCIAHPSSVYPFYPRIKRGALWLLSYLPSLATRQLTWGGWVCERVRVLFLYWCGYAMRTLPFLKIWIMNG